MTRPLRDRRYLSAAICGLLAVCALAADSQSAFVADQYLDHVKYLSSETMEGRATGTRQLERAAGYIAGQFRSFSLSPARGRAYFQAFKVTTNARLGKKNAASYVLDGQRHSLDLRHDCIPLNFSGRGRVTAPAVFVGYGITAPEYGYDDYEGVNVKGKFAVVLRHEPQEHNADSVLAGKIYTEHSQLFSKAVNARRHGARGVLYVNDTAAHGGRHGDLVKFSGGVAPADAVIPFLHVSAAVVEKWMDSAGKDFEKLQKLIDDELQPQSFAFPDSLQITVNVDLKRDEKRVRNVTAYLPGETSEHIIIGAHYDHIGHGEQFSMASGRIGEIHPGADDNASGVAGLIELARWFSSRPKPRRGILFLAFAGEELGLLGSSYYVRHPLLSPQDAVAMLNMDMIGRMRDNQVYVGGVSSGSTFRKSVETRLRAQGITADLTGKVAYGSSDHTSFTTRQIPVLFFFTGLHGDYHRPSDTWDKIDSEASVRLLRAIAGVAEDLISAPARPAYVPPPRPDSISSP